MESNKLYPTQGSERPLATLAQPCRRAVSADVRDTPPIARLATGYSPVVLDTLQHGRSQPVCICTEAELQVLAASTAHIMTFALPDACAWCCRHAASRHARPAAEMSLQPVQALLICPGLAPLTRVHADAPQVVCC